MTPSDVSTTSDATITLTTAGPALTLNSDNALTSGGAIAITDVDNATGILVDTSTARTGSLTVSGNITLDETFTAEDTDNNSGMQTFWAASLQSVITYAALIFARL